MKLVHLKNLMEIYDKEITNKTWKLKYFDAYPFIIKNLRDLYFSIAAGKGPTELLYAELSDFELIKFYATTFYLLAENTLQVAILHKIFNEELFKLENESDKALRERIHLFIQANCFKPDKHFLKNRKTPEADTNNLILHLPEELVVPEFVNCFHAYLEKNLAGFYYWQTKLFCNMKQLYTAENIRAIYADPDLQSFVEIYFPNNLATQPNFDTYKSHVDILCHCISLFNKIPEHQFTQAVFDRIIAICIAAGEDDYKAIEDLKTYVNDVITPEQNQRLYIFNNAQSTHTETVHVTTSESAKQLYQTYKNKIDSRKKLANIINQAETWINSLSSEKITGKHANYLEAAKKGLRRLTCQRFSFVDPVSMISLSQLIAMVWLGIHDVPRLARGKAKKLNTKDILADAKNHFIEGLYDIQRDGNNNVKFIDDNRIDDKFICPPGVFNKLIQILWFCQHTNVNIIYYTPETARDKLQAVVKEKTLAYLLNLHAQSSNSIIAQQELASLRSKIATEFYLPGPIWTGMQEKVTKEMIEEFPLLYPRLGQHHPRFIHLIESVTTIDVSDVLVKFEKLIIEPAEEKKAQDDNINSLQRYSR